MRKIILVISLFLLCDTGNYDIMKMVAGMQLDKLNFHICL